MATAMDVAKYLIALDRQKSDDEEPSDLSNLKLQKLVYYCQGFYLAIFGKPLFQDNIEAWRHGPVVPQLYNNLRQYGRDPVPCFDTLEDVIQSADFGENETQLMDEVYSVFGQFTAWKLRDLTHLEPTWKEHEVQADEITVQELEAYFKTRLN